jgi:hypothetical protein
MEVRNLKKIGTNKNISLKEIHKLDGFYEGKIE